MTTDEFLAWEPGDGLRWQLENGHPEPMAPAAETHAIIQAALVYYLTQHLKTSGHPGIVMVEPGIVPRIMARRNVRIPDIAIAAQRSTRAEPFLHEPILVVEILSPSNAHETWSNIYTYTSIPSVQDILVVYSESIGAEIFTREPDSTWPFEPVTVTDGNLRLPGIGFSAPLFGPYADTHLAR